MLSSLDALTRSSNSVPNKYLGQRFDRDGTFLPEPGNTVVRHVVSGSDTELALLDLREKLQALPAAGLFTFTAPTSLHMTLFQGVIDTEREPAVWPEALPLDMPIYATTEYFAARLADFQGPGPFSMRIAAVTPFGLTLTGATEEDERTARAWRDALCEPFGYRSPGHDSYRFHTTLAYIMDWLPDDLIGPYQAALAELTEEMQARVPVVELGPPAFCTFEDMNAFPPVLVLPGSEEEA